ncbi:UNVERIFIED_CONTAM: hypothetical protein Sradi_5884600 [Sesamum radiatum]|uniref:Reverse transcriptase zinc-binding domain-containing protein n=1 Tax=Sesamum radiatum TaxID=300843 RepID=A0AAW2KS26_SESRA
MSDVVTAFTFKLWWRFRSENSLWAKFLKAKYCKGTPPSCPKASIHNSPNWRRMCKVHSDVQEHIFWILGNGMVSFWFDNWIGEQTLSQITNSPYVGFESVNYYWRDGTWDKHKLDRVVPPNISEMICNIPILQAADDIIKWKPTHDGIFSISSAWDLIREKRTGQRMLKDIWNSGLTPTISTFAWRLLHNWIPVDFRIQQKGIQLASQCQCCNGIETIEHLFLESVTSQLVWNHFAHLFDLQIPHTNDICRMILSWKSSLAFSHSTPHIISILPILILWFLWIERNDSKHRNMSFNAKRIIWRVHNYLWGLQVCKQNGHKWWRGDHHVATQLGLKIQRSEPEKKSLLSDGGNPTIKDSN